ncbi:hypothetical protein ANO14919_027230 [Xylariales sp. No.14919]|nr:hypothetical protein ANO14919_027230 [Xylariales sp. No.14919]
MGEKMNMEELSWAREMNDENALPGSGLIQQLRWYTRRPTLGSYDTLRRGFIPSNRPSKLEKNIARLGFT